MWATTKGHSPMTEIKELKTSLSELLEVTEQLATIVHMITHEQGEAIKNAKKLLSK